MRLINKQEPPSHLSVAFYVAAIFALLPISTDLYLPALPGIRESLGITTAASQLTLSAFIIGFGFAQLVYGPLSDRFGRRRVLMGGITIYIFASAACMLSTSLVLLVLARVIQGVGACSGQVMARAIVRDLYEPQQGAKVLAMMMFLFALIPMFAPLIGGNLAVLFGWRADFAFIGCYGALALCLTWRMLDETNLDRDPRATRAADLRVNAATILRNRTFIAYTLCVTFSYCAVFSYLSTSSFVLLDLYRVRPEVFGFWFMIPVTGNIIGGVICMKLTGTVPLPRLLALGAGISTAGGALMLLLAIQGIAHPLGIMVPMCMFLIGHGITTPVGFAAAAGPFPRLAGTASSLLGFTQLVTASVAGQIVARLFSDSALPLAVAVFLFAAAILVTEYLLVRDRL